MLRVFIKTLFVLQLCYSVFDTTLPLWVYLIEFTTFMLDFFMFNSYGAVKRVFILRIYYILRHPLIPQIGLSKMTCKTRKPLGLSTEVCSICLRDRQISHRDIKIKVSYIILISFIMEVPTT